MEENSQTPIRQNPVPNDAENRLDAPAFLKARVFIFGFAVIVLFLLLGILNYFNILALSSIYQPLSMLPRQAKQNSQPGSSLLNKSDTTPSPTNYTPITFTYDMTRAEELLIQYIKDTIKPKFLPAKIEVKQGLSIDGRTEDTEYEFGSIFSINKDSFSSNFHYKEGSNEPDDFSIYIQPDKKIETATPMLANSFLANYFLDPYTISGCNTKGQVSYCESFQTSSAGKKGYGVVLMDSTSIVFNCFIPKESKYYDTQKSCISP